MVATPSDRKSPRRFASTLFGDHRLFLPVRKNPPVRREKSTDLLRGRPEGLLSLGASFPGARRALPSGLDQPLAGALLLVDGRVVPPPQQLPVGRQPGPQGLPVFPAEQVLRTGPDPGPPPPAAGPARRADPVPHAVAVQGHAP